MGNVQPTNVNFDSKQSQLPPLPQLPQNLKTFFENLPHKMNRKLKSPGLYEDLDEKWTSLQPDSFEGLRVVINQEFNSNVKLMHTINLSTPRPGNYQFKANVVPYEDTPTIWCELDEAGVLKANIMHQLNDRIRLKAVTHFDPTSIKLAHVNADYSGNDFTATMLMSNVNLRRKTGLIAAQYLQSITKEFALGTQIALKLQPDTNWDGASITICGRYTLRDMVCTGSVRKHYAQFRICRDLNPNMKLGVQATANLDNLHMAGKVCSEWLLPQYGSVFRGAFDSFWNICGTIEQRLQQYPLIFTLSCGYNYVENDVKVGVSFTAY